MYTISTAATTLFPVVKTVNGKNLLFLNKIFSPVIKAILLN